MAYKNYTRISGSRRDEEKQGWASEVEAFSKAMDESIKARRFETKTRRRVVFEPIPTIGKTYSA